MTKITIIIIVTIIAIILLLFAIFFSCDIYANNNDWNESAKFANDISELNFTKITNTIDIINESDIINGILLAFSEHKQISMYGAQHTMGGHSIPKNGYRFNMNNFNKILNLDISDENKMTVTVQSGLKWDDLIKYLNVYGLSPMTLQSYSTFSIGGTISANAHGLTNDEVVGNSIVKCSKFENPELFSLVIGGYGLFGIILEVTLKITKNEKYKMVQHVLNIDDFENIHKNARDNKIVKLAKINTITFDKIYFYLLEKDTDNISVVSKLNNSLNSMSTTSRLLYKWILPSYTGQKIRFKLEEIKGKPLEMQTNIIEKNQLLYESTIPISKLKNIFINLNKTHILQEFFIPNKNDNFKKWMLFLKSYFSELKFNQVSLLNIAIRYVETDNVSFLKYAKNNSYAFVFYYRVNKTKNADDILKQIHTDLTNSAIDLGGTFYLPYRHHYTKKQLLTCYPEFAEFVKLKNKYDHSNLFGNLWFDEYSQKIENSL